MTYKTLSDLPENLRREIPRRAQEIYLAAYDRTWEKCAAFEEYPDEPVRLGNSTTFSGISTVRL